MNKTLNKVRLRFYWVEKETRSTPNSGGLEGPMERIALDIMGPLPTTDNTSNRRLFHCCRSIFHTKRKGRNHEPKTGR